MAISGMLAQRLAYESGKGVTFKDEGVDPAKTFSEGLTDWSAGVKKRHDDRLAQIDIDDEALFNAAKNASVRDQAEVERMILDIRDWDKEQIKKGAAADSAKWAEYRSNRRDRLADLRLYSDRSGGTESFYGHAIQQMAASPYIKQEDARSMLRSEMDKPLSERRLAQSLDKMINDSSMYDIDQYLTDKVAEESKRMTQAAYTERDDRHITDYKVKYMAPFFEFDPDTNKLSYRIDPTWARTTLNSAPSWFVGAVELGVRDKESRIKDLIQRQESGELTLDEEIELSKSLPFLGSDSESKRIAVLGEMMNTKAQSEVSLVSKTMSADSGSRPTSKERDLAMQQRFLNARVSGFMDGNYDVIVNELNGYGMASAKQFDWEPGPDGKVRITFLRKEPKRPGSSRESWGKISLDVDPDNEAGIRDALAALYKIRTDEVSSTPSVPDQDPVEATVSRLPEFEGTEYKFNIGVIDRLTKQLKEASGTKNREKIQSDIAKYKKRNAELEKQAQSPQTTKTSTTGKTAARGNPFAPRN